ncbi:MAG: hypothetical protein ABL871_09155 [Terricaulis sp.]
MAEIEACEIAAFEHGFIYAAEIGSGARESAHPLVQQVVEFRCRDHGPSAAITAVTELREPCSLQTRDVIAHTASARERSGAYEATEVSFGDGRG